MKEKQESRLWPSIRLPLLFILALWVIHVLQLAFGLDLGYLGVFPREVFGLRGVVFAPLIHANFGHLINNSIPLFALGAIILFFYPRVANRVLIMTYFLTGLVVWLFARSVFHIGASGVVYGLVAFVFWTGIFRRNLKSIVLSLIVLFYYSGMFLGILPNQEGISWESHLIGGLAGIFVAYWYKEEIEADEQPKRYSWEEEEEAPPETYFLSRDTFDRTREERRREEENDRSDWYSSGTW